MATRSERRAVDREVYLAVGKVPEGTVVTYGQIGRMVGVGPRQVGRALSNLPPDVYCPWHRVINARGTVSIRSGNHKAHLDQERRLLDEGIEFCNGRVDLSVYRWDP